MAATDTITRPRGHADELDDKVQHLIADHLEGLIGEQQARAMIAGLVDASDIVSETVRTNRYYTFSVQRSADVVERLREFILTRILNPELSSAYDLKIGSDASVSGWVRRMCWTAMRSIVRDLQTAANFHPITDPTTMTQVCSIDREHLNGHSSAEPASLGAPPERMLLDKFSDAHDFARAAESLQAKAEALVVACEVPDLPRPDASTRERLAKLLEDDEEQAKANGTVPMLAHDTFQAWLSGDTDDADPDMVALLDPWTFADVESFTEQVAGQMLSSAVHLLMKAAVADLPYPNRERRGLLRAAIGTLDLDPELTHRLTDDLVAAHCEATSAWTFHKDPAELAERQRKWREQRADLLPAIKDAANLLGTQPEQVEQTLNSIALQIGVLRTNQFRETS